MVDAVIHPDEPAPEATTTTAETVRDQGYKWVDIPLTASLAAQLAKEMFVGRRAVRRNAIASSVEALHVEGGGRAGQQNISLIIKKALAQLEADGLAAKSGAFGRWDFSGPEPVSDDSDIVGDDAADDPDLPSPERTIGRGSQAVYVYGYELYRSTAEAVSDTRYPCKVGRTDGAVTSRIYSQMTTSMPEWPQVWLVIRTDTSRTLERVLHGILSLRGQSMSDAPGSEWFMTNPAEIEAIFEWIHLDAANGPTSVGDEPIE
jgi:hypothetical protein